MDTEQHGWLAPADRANLDQLVDKKLAKRDRTKQASLEEVQSQEAEKAQQETSDSQLAATVRCAPPPAGHVLLSALSFKPQSSERYTLNRLHAEGGIGQIWLAYDCNLGREVALKALRPEGVANPAIWARFLEEAKITGRLEHPGIVPVYELFRPSGEQQPFYTMRFIRGRTLTDAVRAYHRQCQAGQGEALALRELLGAFVGICNTMAYAHSRNVVHRDLKGQNVVLGDYGEVMVLDWGEAKVLNGQVPEANGQAEAKTCALTTCLESAVLPDQTMPGQAVGTPAYMSPEQADGRGHDIDQRSDVYGLGAILYEILTSQPPITGSDVQQVLQQVIGESPVRPRERVPTTPPALEAICLKALAKQPGQRYASAKELGQDVERWLADEPVSVYRDQWTVQASRWLRHHRIGVTGFVAGTVAFLCLAAATVLLASAKGREQQAKASAEQYAQAAKKEHAEADKQRQQTVEAGIALGAAYTELGRLSQATTQPLAALKWYALAIQRLTDAQQKDPERQKTKQLLRATYVNQAVAFKGLARYTEAIQACQRALELDGGPSQDVTQLLAEVKQAMEVNDK